MHTLNTQIINGHHAAPIDSMAKYYSGFTDNQFVYFKCSDEINVKKRIKFHFEKSIKFYS